MTSEQHESLKATLEKHERSLLCFTIPRRLAAFRSTGDSDRRQVWACAGLALILPALALVALVLRLSGIARAWNFTDWYVWYYFLLNFSLLAIPIDAWRRLERIAEDVEVLITDRADRERLKSRINTMIRRDVQAVLALVGFLAGLAAAYATTQAHHVSGLASVPFCLSLGLTLALGANVVTWIASGMHWLYIFSVLPSVRYDSVDPMRSPGLRNGYALMARAQAYCTFGLLLALMPLVFLYNDARGSGFLQLALILAGAGSFLVVLLAYTVPPWLLHTTRHRDKEMLLDELRRLLPHTLVGLRDDDLRDIANQLEVYERVNARGTRRGDRIFLTSLLLSVATIAAAFIPLLLGHS